jgi:hypothetical protein
MRLFAIGSAALLAFGAGCATGASFVEDAGPTGVVTVDGGQVVEGGIIILPGTGTGSGTAAGTGTGTGTGTSAATSTGTGTSAGSSTATSSGSDAGGCIDGETLCSLGCTDTTSDPANCGGCGASCSSGNCMNGICLGGSGTGTGTGTGTGGGGYTCAHSPCTSGAALDPNCDQGADQVVSFICNQVRPQCCETSWSMTCAELTQEACGTGTQDDICEDPGC